MAKQQSQKIMSK